MKSKVSLLGALTGTLGIGVNLRSADYLWIGFFVALTAVNVALLLVRNQSNENKPIKEGQ